MMDAYGKDLEELLRNIDPVGVGFLPAGRQDYRKNE
jgi:hypothetical protein